MSWNHNEWTIFLYIMRSQKFELFIINNYLLIYLFENFMKEPSHCSNEWHLIVWNHLYNHWVSLFIDLFSKISWKALFLWSFFNNLLYWLLNKWRVKNQGFIFFKRTRFKILSRSHCPIYVIKVRRLMPLILIQWEDIIFFWERSINFFTQYKAMKSPIKI